LKKGKEEEGVCVRITNNRGQRIDPNYHHIIASNNNNKLNDGRIG
jgi:hypothetical protein